MRKRPMVLLTAVALTTLLMANPATARFDDDSGGGDAPSSQPAPDAGGGSSCDPAYMWCSDSTVAPEPHVPSTTEPQSDPSASDPTVTDPASEPAPWFEPDPAPVVEPDPAPWFDPEPTPVIEPDPAPWFDPEPTPPTSPDPSPWFEPDSTPAPLPEPVPATPVVDLAPSTPSCDWRTEPCLDPGVDTPTLPVPPDTVPPVAEPLPSPDLPPVPITIPSPNPVVLPSCDPRVEPCLDPGDTVPPPTDPVPPVVDEPPTPAPGPVTEPPAPTCDPDVDQCDDPSTPHPDSCAPAADDSGQVFPMGIGVTPVDPCPVAPCEPIIVSFSWFDSIFRPQGIVAVPTDPCAPDTCGGSPDPVVVSFALLDRAGAPVCKSPPSFPIPCERKWLSGDQRVIDFCSVDGVVRVEKKIFGPMWTELDRKVPERGIEFDATLTGKSDLQASLKAAIARVLGSGELSISGGSTITASFKGRVCFSGVEKYSGYVKTVVYRVVYSNGYSQTSQVRTVYSEQNSRRTVTVSIC
jgi:hypothetical protein